MKECFDVKIKMDHLALPVKKLKETGDFYVQILEYIEIPIRASKDPPKRWFIDADKKELHLISSDVNPKKEIVQHLAFATSDLDEFIKRLEKHCVPYYNYSREENQVQIRIDGIRQLYLQDPEGNWIEINEAPFR